MRDNAHALNSQQRSAAILGVVDALLEITKSAAGEQIADLPRNRGLQRLLESGTHKVGYAFRNLERHVAHKAVSNNYIDVAGEQIASFDIADEIQRKVLEQLK